MYPDLRNVKIDGKASYDQIDQKWYNELYIPNVQQRGAAIINARGLSSAA